jgi:hypothetical protein
VSRRWLPLWCCAALVYVFLYAPLVVVIMFSSNAARHGGPWQGFTTEWYVKLLSLDPAAAGLSEGERQDAQEKRRAVTNTLVLATVSATVATVLGTLLGYGLRRYQFPGKRLCSWVLYLPVVPDIVMAVALLLFFALLREWSVWGLARLGYTWPEVFPPLSPAVPRPSHRETPASPQPNASSAACPDRACCTTPCCGPRWQATAGRWERRQRREQVAAAGGGGRPGGRGEWVGESRATGRGASPKRPLA